MNDVLHWEDLEKLAKIFRPILWYAMSDQVPRGQVFYHNRDEHSPEFFVCHPDDFLEISEGIIGRQLRPIKDWKPEWLDEIHS